MFSISVYSIDIEVNSENAGNASGDGDYFHTSAVTLMATFLHEYEFAGWSAVGEIVSTDNPYIFNAYNNRTLVAGFDPVSWMIAVSSDPEGAGVIQGAGEYLHGTVGELTVLANPDFTFIEWMDRRWYLLKTPSGLLQKTI